MRRGLLVCLALPFTATILSTPLKAQETETTAPKTAKERQAGKAYDPQRVNDCKVPLELRDDKTRSTDCGEKAKAAASEGKAPEAEGTSD